MNRLIASFPFEHRDAIEQGHRLLKWYHFIARQTIYTSSQDLFSKPYLILQIECFEETLLIT